MNKMIYNPQHIFLWLKMPLQLITNNFLVQDQKRIQFITFIVDLISS